MKRGQSIAAPLAGLAVFLTVWELFVRLRDIRRFVLLAPSAILEELTRDPGLYFSAMATTAWHMALGLAISLAVSLAVGAAMSASRFVEEASQPVLVIVMVTPWVAYTTSVVIWLGFGVAPILFVVALAAFPVLTFGVVGGMRSADPAARELLASVNASPWEVLWRLRLPSALPSLFTTSRYTVGLALAATYFVEGSSGGRNGLGVLGRRAENNSNIGVEALWTTILCTAALGIAALILVTVAERTLLRWHASQQH